MTSEIEKRSRRIALYMIRRKCTVRQAAKKFGVCRSTVHIDVTERLREIDLQLYNQIQELLAKNKAERAARGGRATKSKLVKQK